MKLLPPCVDSSVLLRSTDVPLTQIRENRGGSVFTMREVPMKLVRQNTGKEFTGDTKNKTAHMWSAGYLYFQRLAQLRSILCSSHAGIPYAPARAIFVRGCEQSLINV